MSEENKIRDAADAIKGIAEAVPVYQDVLQPAAREIGTALQTVAKTIHVALAPLSALVWGYDRICEYLESTLTNKFKDVPPERIVSPSPMVAGPILESMRFTAHEPTLRELYANLLAAAMDKETIHTAHPAFVEIIRQLTSDEARIFKLISAKGAYPLVDIEVFGEGGKRMRGEFSLPYVRLVKAAKLCSYPVDVKDSHHHVVASGLNNLSRLGLIEISPYKGKLTLSITVDKTVSILEDEAFELKREGKASDWVRYLNQLGVDLIDEYELLLQSDPLKSNFPEIDGMTAEVQMVSLSPLGRQFSSACISQDSVPTT